jgi:all-trans-8'-apo-beta-carotenal 15,15'-oxygenase
MADFDDVLRAPPEARDARLSVIEGAVPRALRGTLLRNGPGTQHAGSTPLHFLDGYAMAASARFEDGEVVHQARHVVLPVELREREAGRMLERRPLTNLPGGRWANLFRLAATTTVAHDVYAWGGSVVVTDVGGQHRLDPRSLESQGPSPLSGSVSGLAQLSPMPRIDRVQGRLVTYVLTPGLFGADTVTILEHDEAWKEVHRVTRSLGMKGALLHDLAVTEHHYVIAQLGRVDPARAAFGSGALYDAVGVPPGAARLVLVPRRGEGPLRSLPLPANHQGFHLVNAYEEGGRLIVDTTIYDGMPDFHPFDPAATRGTEFRKNAGPFVARHTFELERGAHELVVHRGAVGEAPSVRDDLHGRRHRFAYVSAPGTRGDEPLETAYFWFHGVAKIDCDAGTTASSWDAGPRVFVSAPQFVAGGAAEDEGWVLAWTHDVAAQRGELVVLDAADLGHGPIARLALPAPLPPASHVDWMPA